MTTNVKPRNWKPNVRTSYQATLSLLVATCLSLNLHAQALDAVLLFNWAAPLYWQPSETEDKGVQVTRNATTPVGALVFVGMTPCRLVDTRSSSNPPFTGGFGPPILAGQASRTFPIRSSTTCAVPSNAQAYSFNVTVVPPGFLGFITVFPTGQPRPVASTLNSLQGFIVANAAVVPAGTNGSVDVFANNPTELIIDINGFYAPPTGLTLATGTAAAPSLSFSGDAETGIFSSGAGVLNIATGGTSRLTVRADGDLDMAGNIRKGGSLFLHNLGTLNTAVGLFALSSNTAGVGNTATGALALSSNTTGNDNTATGAFALNSNTTGGDNTATGDGALGLNTSGANNTATGPGALARNTVGSDNTATGAFALSSSTGVANTAIGSGALDNTTGGGNTALGGHAGTNITTGSNNVMIANLGSSTDDGVTRIGQAQTRTFVAGIRGVTTGLANAIPVFIDPSGQLGTASSSRRVKRDIGDLGDTTAAVMNLRPVRFRYTGHGPEAPVQYGLVAEEVAEVAPELVVRNQDGEIETVFYDKVNTMLLNEVQKQHRQIQRQQGQIQELQSRLAAIEAAVQNRDQSGNPVR